MPSGLSPAAARHWALVVPQLVKMGVARAVDSTSLGAMCEAYSRLADMQRYYRRASVKQRLVIVGKVNQAQDTWVKLAARFGMTPSDRASLQVEEAQQTSEFEDMLA